MTTPSNDTPDWVAGELHAALVTALPLYVRDLFSDASRIDVSKLSKALVKPNGRSTSYETVYKWLRANKLTPGNVRLIINLANEPDNLAVLGKLDREAPKIEDFSRFAFA